VLPAKAVVTVTEVATSIEAGPPIPVAPRHQSLSWEQVAWTTYAAGVLVSLLRLAGGHRYAWRLVKGARRVEGELYESGAIAVPMTVGWRCPKILLPLAWRDWDDRRLEAVLAHERAHIGRGDWLVAALAAVNRSVFWFHPLAWWLERRLAALAEQACDDAAILETGRPSEYAQTLLEMAAAVKATGSRVAWETLAMARAGEVSVRIDRILDDARTVSVGVNRWTKFALVSLGLPLIAAAILLQVVPAVAQEQAAPPKPTEQREQAPPAKPAKPQEQAPPPAVQAHPRTVPAPARKPEPQSEPLQLLHSVEPEYPKIAKMTGAHGTVQLDATVGVDGHISAVRVLSGHPMLQNAAKEAVLQWVYAAPAKETHTNVSLNFVAPEPSTPASSLPAIQQAVLISRVAPIYPKAAKQAGVRGAVVLNATIDTQGNVSAVRVIKGDDLLNEAAVEAVKQWRYKPTMMNGQPVVTETQITLNFVGEGGPGGQIEPAQLIERKEPVHPGGELASLSGTVKFLATIGMDGRLKDIRVADGPAELVPAALAAVKQWVYRPAKLNGQLMETRTEISLTFTPGR
jgi:TonB family protein